MSTDTAYSCDPRIKKFKEEEKARKESEKKAKAEAKKREQEEKERVSVVLFWKYKEMSGGKLHREMSSRSSWGSASNGFHLFSRPCKQRWKRHAC